ETIADRVLGAGHQLWPWLEIVQRNDTDCCRCERGGNLRIAYICKMRHPADIEPLQRGVESGADLSSSSGKVDQRALRGDEIDCETAAREPVGDGCKIGGRQTKTCPELGR